jgi:Protein kinase domain
VRPVFTPNAVVGKWTLIELLGTGGNSEVWRATRGDETVALKIVPRRPESEPFRRFVREVEASRALAELPGILPVLETRLPDNPSRRDPAWIAMPVATPVREALADAPVEEVVRAVHSFAVTLAAVAERRMSHRDIKPGNLYRYIDQWAVADFGLVSLPNADAITTERLGPAGFIPDEMFENAGEADGRLVDVFQIAKTLSVLAVRQEYPPQGHIAAGSWGALSRFVVHPRVRALEELIDHCTRRDPRARPTMAAVAEELEAWLETADEPLSDVSAVAARFRAANAGNLAERARAAEFEERFRSVASQAVARVLDPVASTLLSAGLTPEESYSHTLDSWIELDIYSGSSQRSLARETRWVTAQYGPVGWPREIAVGVGFDIDDQGTFWCTAHVAVGDTSSVATRDFQFEARSVSVERSAAVRRHYRRAFAGSDGGARTGTFRAS